MSEQSDDLARWFTEGGELPERYARGGYIQPGEESDQGRYLFGECLVAIIPHSMRQS